MAFDPATATFALKVGQTLFGANQQARQNRALISGNKVAIGELDKSIDMLPEVSVSKQEVAKDEYKFGFELSGQKTSSMFDDLYKKEDVLNNSQKFAFSGQTENELSILTDKLNKDFLYKYKGLNRALDKQFASIEESRIQQEQSLKSEKLKLELENKRLSKTDTFWEALGF
jgi:hypothetical protein